MSSEARPPGQPDHPAEPPTTEWTPPQAGPPPDAPPAAPYSSGSGPLLSATPTVAPGWAQQVDERREVAPGLVFSGTAPRFVAYWIDSIILTLVGSVITAGVGSATPFTPTGGFVWSTGDYLATILILAIDGAYFVGFWTGGRRATLGQMLLKIQVGNAFDGKSLTLEQAIRRWLALGQFLSVFAVTATAVGAVAVLSLVWTLVLFISTVTSPTKQGLHDRFANTAVVRPANAGNGLVYTCLFVLIGLPILALLAIVALIFLGGQTGDILSRIGTSV
jgi:uncharacterized RDD family membrane protein YckC